MSLRVIAGTWKGRRLAAPAGLATRPIPDRIKQSLFDALGQDLAGWRVADCCAGSGAFGIEAASRGAAEVHLIENSPDAAAIIRSNLDHIGNPDSLQLREDDFEKVLPTLSNLDLVFADPPFPWFRDDPKRISTLLSLATKAISPEGQVMIRGERGTKLPSAGQGLHMDDWREYGRSWVAVLRHRKED